MSCPSFIIGARRLSTLSDNCVRIINRKEEEDSFFKDDCNTDTVTSVFLTQCVFEHTFYVELNNNARLTCCKALSNHWINVMQRDCIHNNIQHCLKSSLLAEGHIQAAALGIQSVLI